MLGNAGFNVNAALGLGYSLDNLRVWLLAFFLREFQHFQGDWAEPLRAFSETLPFLSVLALVGPSLPLMLFLRVLASGSRISS
jgi:hypothetical protein